MRPSYDGGGLVNLVCELERRLTGGAPHPGLDQGEVVPHAAGYVLAVFDGLGAHQLGIGEALGLAEASAATLTTVFPSTTTASFATLATGLAPTGHGIIGHIVRLPGIPELVDVLTWATPAGKRVVVDHSAMLPAPNLWERLRSYGIEPIAVQPRRLMSSPLSRMLYRGCRVEPAGSVRQLIDITCELAGSGRLVVPYFPRVDMAGHRRGQNSRAYRRAVSTAARIWEGVSARMPGNVCAWSLRGPPSQSSSIRLASRPTTR